MEDLEEIGVHMEYKEVSLAPDGDEAPTSFGVKVLILPGSGCRR